jgi:hypothetical protein
VPCIHRRPSGADSFFLSNQPRSTVNVLCDISHIQIDLARHPFSLEYVFKDTLAQALPSASSEEFGGNIQRPDTWT